MRLKSALFKKVLIMKFVFMLLIIVSLAGCATNPSLVIPKENGIFIVKSESYSETESTGLALEKAAETCSSNEQRHIVKSISTEYKGTLDKELAGAVLAAASVLASVTGTYYGNVSTDQDYQTTLVFKCE